MNSTLAEGRSESRALKSLGQVCGSRIRPAGLSCDGFEKPFLRFFEKCHGLFARYRRKSVEEVVNRIAAFQEFEQRRAFSGPGADAPVTLLAVATA